MRLVAERYGVPEIKKLTTFENAHAGITSNCGIKRNFGFLYHREGERQNPLECHEFPIPKITHTETHFFRQDVDAWMLAVAVKYGVTVKQRTKVTAVDIDDSGVTIHAENGATFRARYVVDASGYRSPIAQRFALRETPTRLRHHSRSLFTHMIDVMPYEDTVRPRGAHGNPTPWSQGTLHHLFEGGWAWVIPFNNHARATNPLISVGLNLDPRLHPAPDCSPEEEFRSFIARFPDIRKQFARSVSVRDWVSTSRLQYSSHQTTGYRWCLTSHAAGFVDALFSRGLSNSLEIVNALTCRLLDALREDDFSPERFAYVQTLEQGLLDFNDDLVANAYTSFSDFELWDAWFRVWSAGQILATFEINRTYAKYLQNHDDAELKHLERIAPSGAIPDYAPARALIADVSNDVQEVAAGRTPAPEAARRIMTRLQGCDFIPPAFGLTQPENRWFNAKVHKVAHALVWARRCAPPEIGDLVHEGLSLFLRKRLSRDEFNLAEEAKHALAGLPVIGARLRTPAPL
jgi:FADH2 O2-dependent halogenase